MVKLDIIQPVGYTHSSVKTEIFRILHMVGEDELFDIEILKETLKTDDRDNIFYKLTVGVSFSEDREAGLLKMKKIISPVPDLSLEPRRAKIPLRPVVVGAGPAGMFCALYLAMSGARPLVLERGRSVAQRDERIADFIKNRKFDPESNVQFGEGGAGTYSDGKLKVGGMDKYKSFILRTLVETGATKDILFSSSAHVGTDKLKAVVQSIRAKILSLGGEYIFGAKFTGFAVGATGAKTVSYIKDGVDYSIETGDLVLAIGHSARDTIRTLYSLGMPMESKGFGVGMRIEHPREYINQLIHGKSASALPTASYHLVTHLKCGRSVYSFCMCPGGTVVAATGSKDSVVTNGMSEYKRNAANSNSAILVSVTPCDFKSDHPLAGFEFQEGMERRAFTAAGGDYTAPAIRLSDIMDAPASSVEPAPSYPLGTVAVNPGIYLPEFIPASIAAAMPDFDARIPGFMIGSAALTGPETRTTSPVRILRGADYSSPVYPGVYPCGEGAGYAGGIISSAYDGVRVAEAIILAHPADDFD